VPAKDLKEFIVWVMKEALTDPGVRKNLEDLGQEIPPVDQQIPEALRAHHKAEIEKWWPVIKQAGIKAELCNLWRVVLAECSDHVSVLRGFVF
jgi:tripartite-type tricarboxylate transporter receptor subunit TctC